MKRLPWLWATVAVLGVYYFIRYAIAPFSYDDGVYFAISSVQDHYGVRVFDFHKLLHIFNVNAWSPRISNVCVPLLMIVPMWVKGLVGATAQIITLTIGAKFAGLTTRNSMMLCSLMAFLYIVALPWYDPMMACAYLTNYTLTTMMLMILIAAFLRAKPLPWWSVAIFTLFYSFWHEGYTAFTLCAFGLVLVVYRRMWRADRWAIVASLAIAMTAFALMPATHMRMNVCNYSISRPELILQALGIEIFLAVACICLVSKNLRKKVASPLLIVLIGIALASYCQHWILRIAARSLHPGLVCSTFGIIYIIIHITPHDYFNSRRWHVTAFAIYTFLLIHFAFVIHYDKILLRESVAIEKEFVKHPMSTLFMPLESTRNAPLITLRHTFGNTWHPGYFTRLTMALQHFEEAETLDTMYVRVVPAELKNYRYGMGQRINSNCEVYSYRGRYVARLNDIHPSGPVGEGISEVRFSNGYKYGRRYYFEKFVGADSITYAWICPNGSWLEDICGPITELHLY